MYARTFGRESCTVDVLGTLSPSKLSPVFGQRCPAPWTSASSSASPTSSFFIYLTRRPRIQLMATVHAPKSITEQEAEGWAGSHTVHDVFPLPQLPLTRARLHAVLSILHTVTQSCMPPAWDNQNCLFPELAPAEMVQSHCTKFLVQHEKLAQDARRDLADDKRILTKDKEVAVMRGLGSVGGLRVRPNNPLHNFVEVSPFHREATCIRLTFDSQLIYQGDTGKQL